VVSENVFIALFITSIFSAVGAFLLYTSEERFNQLKPYLLSLSAGAIFGGVFIHLIFRLANKFTYGRLTGLLVVSGIGGSLVLEKIVHWHCHHQKTHADPLPYVLATGDAVHNMLDGILISTSFIASESAGIAATAAVIAHKIPKEMGDFGVMVDGGFSRPKALTANAALSIFMFVGAGTVLAANQISAYTVTILLPIVIGNFVFIAGSDLLPELRNSENWVKHLAVFLVGVGLMYAVPVVKTAIR
jgi:zinc and cadmium transporter